MISHLWPRWLRWALLAGETAEVAEGVCFCTHPVTSVLGLAYCRFFLKPCSPQHRSGLVHFILSHGYVPVSLSFLRLWLLQSKGIAD